MNIIADLEVYFKGGDIICPYARRSRKVFVSERELNKQASLIVSVVANRDVPVIYAEHDYLDFEQARKWSYETFERLAVILDGESFDDKPFLSVPSVTLYIIGMGPQYPSYREREQPKPTKKPHPRYAPHLCLVATNEKQISEVSFQERVPIKRDMIRRVGLIYDADHIWLEIKPKSKMEFVTEPGNII